MRRVIPAIALLAFACTKTPTTPDVQFAKGGKNTPPEVSLVEYWIVPQSDGSSLIHVVADATGPIDAVWADVAHDVNVTNGIMDWDPHFELPRDGLVEPVRGPFGPGEFHVDLIFRGPWPDELTTDGADPFVFQLRFWTAGFDTQNFYYRGPSPRPQGVIVGGIVKGTENVEVPDTHGVTTANSFATFVGGDSTGSVWVEGLTLSNVTCSKRRQKGQTITRVEGDFTAELSTRDAFMELHLFDGTNIGPRLTSLYGSAAGHVTAEFEGYDPKNLQVSLWLDYVAANDRFVVYNPENNNVPTNGNLAYTIPQPCGG